MANESFKIKHSANIKSGGTGSASGDITVNSNELEFHNGTSVKKLATESNTLTLSNKTLDNTSVATLADDNFTLQDDGDATKQAQFQLSGITTGNTRTLTVPDASTTIVGHDATQTLSNKTLGNTNVVTLADDNFTLQDDGDATKQAQFQLSSITTGNTRTLTVPDASTTIVGHDATQTLTNKTIDADSNTISNIKDDEIGAAAAIAVNKLAALTASRALESDGSGFISASAVTSTELGYVSGVTSAIQTQLDGKASSTSFAPTIQRFTSGSGTYYLTYLFTVTAANATAADTYTNNGETFTVVETIAGDTTLRCTGTGAPDASGTLTRSSGSGDATITFSSVAKPVRLLVELVGGGGGGRGSGTTTSAGSGSNGNDSTFGSSLLTAGLGTGATGTGGGAGGTSTIASPAYGITIPGGIGGTGFDTATTGIFAAGGFGGGTGLVSGTAGYLNVDAVAATANTGTGGAGAGNGSSVGNRAGGGGGGAGYLLAVIPNPSASYPYSIGAGGGGGTAGTTGFIGGAGASGVCTVWEEYQ